MKIIAQSPFTKPSPATARGCVVIRENHRQYVVHNAEADEDGRLVAFYWGHYIPVSGPTTSLFRVPTPREKTLTSWAVRHLPVYAVATQMTFRIGSGPAPTPCPRCLS